MESLDIVHAQRLIESVFQNHMVNNNNEKVCVLLENLESVQVAKLPTFIRFGKHSALKRKIHDITHMIWNFDLFDANEALALLYTGNQPCHPWVALLHVEVGIYLEFIILLAFAIEWTMKL